MPRCDAIVVATTRPETMLGDVGRGRASGRRSLSRPHRANRGAAHREHRDPDHRRQLHRPDIRQRRGEDHAGARRERLRGRPASRAADAGGDHATGTMGEESPRETTSAAKRSNACRNRCAGWIASRRARRSWRCSKASGRLVKVEPHQHAVRRCYRCDTVVEPRLSDQWFVKMKPLAEPALAAVRDGRIRIVPERWEGVYVHWLETIRDWNISRQLWWGHRIPVWYCDGCGRDDGEPGRRVHLPVVFGARAPGRRRARHVVLVMAVALLHAGLAEGHARPSGVLSDRRARERTRHPVLLGRADDHDRASSSWARRRFTPCTCTAWSATRSTARCPSR